MEVSAALHAVARDLRLVLGMVDDGTRDVEVARWIGCVSLTLSASTSHFLGVRH